jgi:predicted acyl esterase
MRPGQWRDLADWPPPESTRQQWRPRGDGALIPASREPETPEGDAGDSTVATVRYDPASPTPSVGGPRTADIEISLASAALFLPVVAS